MRGGALASCDSDVRQSSLVRRGVAKAHCLAVPARETGYVGRDSVRYSVEKAEVESSSERGRRNIGCCFEGRNGCGFASGGRGTSNSVVVFACGEMPRR